MFRSAPLLWSQKAFVEEQVLFPWLRRPVFGVRIFTSANVEVVQDAVREVVEKHDALHLQVQGEGDLPMQARCRSLRHEDYLTSERLRGGARQDFNRYITLRMTLMLRETLDYSRWPAFRCHVVAWRSEIALLANFSHVFIDGRARDLIFAQIDELVATGATDTSVEGTSFLEHANLEYERYRQQAKGVNAEYWRRQLDRPQTFPRSMAVAALQKGARTDCSRTFEVVPTQDLERKGASAFACVVAATSSVLGYRLGVSELVCHTALDGRSALQRQCVGMFSRGFPLIVPTSADLKQNIEGTGRSILGALRHRHVEPARCSSLWPYLGKYPQLDAWMSASWRQLPSAGHMPVSAPFETGRAISYASSGAHLEVRTNELQTRATLTLSDSYFGDAVGEIAQSCENLVIGLAAS